MKLKNLLLLMSTVLVINLFSQGQTIELNFAGVETNTNNAVNLDSIFIRNETQGVDTMLYGITTFELVHTGIGVVKEKPKSFNIHQNYPNPYQDNTKFMISLEDRDEITII